MIKHKFFLTVLLTLLCLASFAQQTENNVEMADVMRANGKIYVVVGIILIILTGLVLYLVLLDRKIKKLEQRLPQK